MPVASVQQDDRIVRSSRIPRIAGAWFLVTLGVASAANAEDGFQKLLPAGGEPSARFGRTIAIDGDTAVIGSPFEDVNGIGFAGAAYVFVRDTDGFWTEHARLVASDPKPLLAFGYSVSIEGATIVVGAPMDDVAGAYSGSAYVFSRDSGFWSEQQKLIPENGGPGDWFGIAVAIEGDWATVGAHQMNLSRGVELLLDSEIKALLLASWDDRVARNTSEVYTGRVYAFARGADARWAEQQQIEPEDPTPDKRFGGSLAIDDGTLVIGAVGDYESGFFFGGAAYVFVVADNGEWIQEKKLLATNTSGDDRFGFSTGLEGDIVIVGAHTHRSFGIRTGAANVFVRNLSGFWIEEDYLVASDGANDDQFGVSVGICDGIAIVGAHRDDDQGPQSGSFYVFERTASGQWAEENRLSPGDGREMAWFGFALAIDGGSAIVGAPRDSDNGPLSGSAYAYWFTITVTVDVKPDSYPNSVNPYARGVIPVAILGSDTFDVADVDVTTLALGLNGAATAHDLTDSFTYNDHLQDVNLDGYMDLVTHYRTRYTGIACGDGSATLTGETLEGQPFEGADSIQTVGCLVMRWPAIWKKDQDKPDTARRDGPINIERR